MKDYCYTNKTIVIGNSCTPNKNIDTSLNNYQPTNTSLSNVNWSGGSNKYFNNNQSSGNKLTNLSYGTVNKII